MRIVKLDPSREEFDSLEKVRLFFEKTLPNRFDGRFRITDRRIRADGLAIGEMVLFSYKGQVFYVARAASRRHVNDDKYAASLPFFFEVDRNSINPVDISLAEIEERYQAATGEFKNLVRARGWPTVQDPVFEQNLWRELVG